MATQALDCDVLVGAVRPAAVPEAAEGQGDAELASEQVVRCDAGGPGPNLDRARGVALDRAHQGGDWRLRERALGRRVTLQHVDADIAVTVGLEVGADGVDDVVGLHVGDQADVEAGLGLHGDYGAGAGVARR